METVAGGLSECREPDNARGAVGGEPFLDEGIRREMIAVLPQLRRFAYGLTGSIADGDDLVQATCERAIANLDKWEVGTRLDSWMFRIAQNLHRNAIRDTRSRAAKLDDLGQASPGSTDGEARQEERSTLAAVRRFLEGLPEEQRTVMLLICVEGRSYKEVAEITGLPVGTVTSRLGRARTALREYLDGPGENGGHGSEAAAAPQSQAQGGAA